jgi:succinoglycan biosynthesis protein ExoM
VVRGEPLRAQPGPFNVAYGLTTGEDADLLIRMVHAGSRVVWCDEAIVVEPIEKARLSLGWLLRRALSGGQEYARKTLAGKYGHITLPGRVQLFVRALAQLAVASIAAPLSYPLGRHLAAQWLVKASANLGKLSIFWGSRYEEYAKV